MVMFRRNDIKKIEGCIGLKDLAVRKPINEKVYFQINDGHIDNILKSEYNALVVGNKMKIRIF